MHAGVLTGREDVHVQTCAESVDPKARLQEASCSLQASASARVATVRHRRAPIRMLASVLWMLAVVLLQLPHTHGRQAQTSESAASLRSVPEGWWMPSAPQGSVRGGSLLTLAATRFDLSTPYVAKFTGVNDEAAAHFSVEVEAAPTLPTSLTKLVVVVPSWPAHETNVTVSLLEAGLTSLAPARGNTTSFEFLSDITSIEGATVPIWRPPSDFSRMYTSASNLL